jgi:anti-anti-sigma factor
MTNAEVSVESDGHAASVALRGEIDLANAAEVQRKIYAGLDNTLTTVTVDLTDLSYLDSAGLRIFFGLVQRLQLLQIAVELLVAPTSVVRRVIELSGLPALVPLRPDRA